MAKRLNLNHDDETRRKIQVSQLINRLNNHINHKDGSDMTATQLKAAEILLKKALPDLSSVEMTGKDGKDLIPESIEITLHDSPQAGHTESVCGTPEA